MSTENYLPPSLVQDYNAKYRDWKLCDPSSLSINHLPKEFQLSYSTRGGGGGAVVGHFSMGGQKKIIFSIKMAEMHRGILLGEIKNFME